MLGQRISLALLSVAGLTHALPTAQVDIGDGAVDLLPEEPIGAPSLGFEDDISGAPHPVTPAPEPEVGDPFFTVDPKVKRALTEKRTVNLPAGVVFEECAALDLAGAEDAYTLLLNEYGSSPNPVGYAAMQPLHNILVGCGMNVLKKRDGGVGRVWGSLDALKKRSPFTAPTSEAPFDVQPLKKVYSQLESAMGPHPTSLTDLIVLDSILSTIDMNTNGHVKRSTQMGKRATCSTAKVQALRLALASVSAAYVDGDVPPMAIYLIAENLIASLVDCGFIISLDDVFNFGEPVTGDLEPDPTVPGGPIDPDVPVEGGAIEPDVPVEGGAIEPDPTVPGGSLEPDPVVPGGSMDPDPVVTVTLTPGSIVDGGEMVADPVETGASTFTPKEKRDSGIYLGMPKSGDIIADDLVPGGALVPDTPIGTAFTVGKKEKRDDGVWFGIGEPIVGGLIPDIPVPPKKFRPGKRDGPINVFALEEALTTLEATYGRACDVKLPPSILIAQQTLVRIIFTESGKIWPGWEAVELNGGIIEFGPVISTGPEISD